MVNYSVVTGAHRSVSSGSVQVEVSLPGISVASTTMKDTDFLSTDADMTTIPCR